MRAARGTHRRPKPLSKRLKYYRAYVSPQLSQLLRREESSEETKNPLFEAKNKRLEAMRAMLRADDRQLINVDNTKCSRDSDGKRIREAIRNDKEAITKLIAGKIRERIRFEDEDLLCHQIRRPSWAKTI